MFIFMDTSEAFLLQLMFSSLNILAVKLTFQEFNFQDENSDLQINSQLANSFLICIFVGYMYTVYS